MLNFAKHHLPWRNMNVKIYLDTETTGLGDDAEIIEIGIIDENGAVLLDTRVQCQGEISPEAQQVHRITAKDLIDAPQWPQIHAQVERIIQGASSVRMYNAPFDVAMLSQTARRYGLTFDPIRSMCVMREYCRVNDHYRWTSLEDACDWEGLDVSEYSAHSAIGDCQRTRLLSDLLTEQRKEQERRRERARKERQRRERAKQRKLDALNTPDASKHHEYPYFATWRPEGYKTFTQIKMSECADFEFAGLCCTSYGQQGLLYKPKNAD